MKDIQIRDLDLEDLSKPDFALALAALSPVGIDLKRSHDVYYARQHAGIRTLVAVSEGVVLGTASIIIEQKFIRAGGKVGHIEDVAVKETHQHIGLGRMLVEALLKVAKDSECYKVILDCDSDVVAFYEKFGFKKYEHCMRLDFPLQEK